MGYAKRTVMAELFQSADGEERGGNLLHGREYGAERLKAPSPHAGGGGRLFGHARKAPNTQQLRDLVGNTCKLTNNASGAAWCELFKVWEKFNVSKQNETSRCAGTVDDLNSIGGRCGRIHQCTHWRHFRRLLPARSRSFGNLRKRHRRRPGAGAGDQGIRRESQSSATRQGRNR